MPLTLDPAVPQLTTVSRPDGFQYELMIRVGPDEPEITKIRIGPYNFKPQYRPRPMLGGLLNSGGPENIFWMHRSTPPGWSRPKWEQAVDEPGEPFYIAWSGHLDPGKIGVFRFLSIFPPGGLRAGLVIYRGDEVTKLGVTGPNWEKFEVGGHGH